MRELFRKWGPLFCIATLALVLRLLFVSVQPLDADEAMHLHPRSFSDTVTFDLMFNPPLFRLLVQFVCLVERTAACARMIPIAAGTTTVVLLWFLACELANRRTAFLASLMLTVHPWHIRHSQTVRSFALLTMLTTALVLLTVRSRPRSKTGAPLENRTDGSESSAQRTNGCGPTTDYSNHSQDREVGYNQAAATRARAALHALALLAHYLAVFPLLFDAMLECIRGRWKKAAVLLAPAGGIVAVLLPALLGGMAEKTGRAPMVHYDSGWDFVVALARSSFAPGGLALATGLFLALFGFAARSMLIPLAWVASYAGGVLLLGTAIPIEVRYCLPVLPLLLLAAARGASLVTRCTSLPTCILGLAILGLLIAGIAWPLPAYWRSMDHPEQAASIHHDLSHVEFSLARHIEVASGPAYSNMDLFVAMRGAEHYRVALELHQGTYPDSATIQPAGDLVALRLPERTIFKLEMPDSPPGREWTAPIPLPPLTRYLVLVENRVAFAKPDRCKTLVSSPEADLWECRL